MAVGKPIYSIAKDLNIDSNRVILACKTLGIYAKASSKRLNIEELNKVLNYFETGKNVSEEIIELNSKGFKKNTDKIKAKKKVDLNKLKKVDFFPNRLIG